MLAGRGYLGGIPMKRSFGVNAVVAAGIAVAISSAAAEEPRRERGLPDKNMVMPPAASVSAKVIVKLREGSRERTGSGGVESLRATTVAPLAGALTRRGKSVQALRRLHTRPAAELDAERAAAETRSGIELADLNLYYTIDVASPAEAIALARELNGLDAVEIAEPAPAPSPLPIDIAPTTPNLRGNQGYRAAPPLGVGSLDTRAGGRGGRMRVVDIEYSWTLNHEDLGLPASSNIDSATASDPFPADQRNHGTAVLGELRGGNNRYGVTGIAAAAQVLVAPANTLQFGYNVARAISLATNRLAAGDVILLEQQAPVCGGLCSTSQVGCGPVEYHQSVFDVIRTATARGIVVVEAAGNGNVNLDRPSCGGRFDRRLRDSGAIIVGAGEPGTRRRLSFSSYGSRVDLQGWGSGVTTTGYGDAFNPGDIRQRYTFRFGGTSSASPIVAGSVLALQGALKGAGRPVARPASMRSALVATGSPQVGSGKIGPLPNLPAALNRLLGTRPAAPGLVASAN